MGLLDKLKSGTVYTAKVAFLPAYTAWVIFTETGEMEIVNQGSPEAKTVNDLVLEGVLDDVTDYTTDWLKGIDWEGIGEAVGKAASEVIKATTEVTSGIAKEIVPDLIEGVERGYDVVRTKLSGAEADVISAFVVGFLVIFTMIYLFYEIRRGK